MSSSTVNSRVLPFVWQLLLVSSAFIPTGWAAVANCTPSWEWSYNSMGQNPCEVAGYLQGACLGNDSYQLSSLDPGSQYKDPGKGDTNGLKCGCNTVIYSLYSGCTACQNAPTNTWAQWSGNCDAVYVAQYPFDIPGATAVPQWAFINITGADSFNATAAMNVGRDPEVLGTVPTALVLPPPLLTSISPSSTVYSSVSGTFNSSSTNGGDNFGGDTSKHSDLLPIIGGVVGGVVGFSILSLLIWCFLRRRSREVPFHVTRRPSSHRTLSTRSYYPSSASVYSNDEPEMDENGGQAPGVYSRLSTAPYEFTHDRRDSYSIISGESDSQTTNVSALHASGKGGNNPTEF